MDKFTKKRPAYEALEKKPAAVEQQPEQYQTGALQYPPETVSVLMEAFRHIPLCKTFEDAAKHILDHCKRLTGACSGYVALLSENGEVNEVLYLDAGGLPFDVDPNLPMPIRGLREIAYKTKEVAYDNAFTESPWLKYMPDGHVKLDNVLFAPLTIENKTAGVICIANKPGGFQKKDVHISKITGDLAAVALTYARTQESLKESETKYRHLVSNLPGTAYQLTLSPKGDFQFEFIGESCVALFDVSAAEIMANANVVFDMIPQPDADIVQNAIKASAASLTPYDIDHRVIQKNGETVWIHASSTPRQLDDGSILWNGIGLNITKRKKAEKAVKENELQYRKLFDKSIDAIFLVEKATGRYLDANESAEILTGRTLSELKQTTTKEVTPIDTEQRLNKINSGGDVFEFGEVVYIRPDGTERIARLHSVALDDKTFFGIAQDITDHKKIEHQLNQAQKMESIGNLAGGIAHDFNNILFPIVGLSEMMLEDFPSGSMEHQNLHEIFQAGKRGRELVQQILSFSRQSENHLIPLQIQKILKEVLKLCRATIPADISITQDLWHDCGLVMADPTQIHQIAMNLITNAFHAVEPSGGNIRVQLKEIDFNRKDDPAVQLASGRYVLLSVADTGAGIYPVVLDRIFDPYFTTKKKGKGTGLGLSTVYGIVKAYGGDIRVHSEVGKGSCFHVYLPVMERSTGAAPEKQPQMLPKGTEHILLADDERSCRKSTGITGYHE